MADFPLINSGKFETNPIFKKNTESRDEWDSNPRLSAVFLIRLINPHYMKLIELLIFLQKKALKRVKNFPPL